jgi:hypothetical protein
MLDVKSSYREMIEARVSRAADIVLKYGFDSESKGSLLEIFNEHASASVLFRSDHIVLEQLNVRLDERRRHHGSAILEVVIAIANGADLRLELIAEPPMHPAQADLTQHQLQAWYRRHRFVDSGDDILMSRVPDMIGRGAPFAGFPLSAFWAGRRDKFARYARGGLAYSEAASAAFYGLTFSFFADWCDAGIAAIDRWTMTTPRRRLPGD